MRLYSPRPPAGTSRGQTNHGMDQLPRSNQTPFANLPWPAMARPQQSRAQAQSGDCQVPTKQPWTVGMLARANMSRPQQAEVLSRRAPQNIKPSVWKSSNCWNLGAAKRRQLEAAASVSALPPPPSPPLAAKILPLSWMSTANKQLLARPLFKPHLNTPRHLILCKYNTEKY